MGVPVGYSFLVRDLSCLPACAGKTGLVETGSQRWNDGGCISLPLFRDSVPVHFLGQSRAGDPERFASIAVMPVHLLENPLSVLPTA